MSKSSRNVCGLRLPSALIFFQFVLFTGYLMAEQGSIEGPLGTVSNIVTEDFEGTWPSGLWSATEDPGSGCAWGLTDVDADGGDWSVSPVAGGSCGGNPSGPYPQDVTTWMIYGPFDLSDAVTASMTFRHKVELESGVDFLLAGYSNNFPNDLNFPFFVTGGSYTWTDGNMDLSAMAGESQVWAYLVVETDGNATGDRGVLIDNISIDKDSSLPDYDLALQNVDAPDGTYLPGAQIGVPVSIENVSVENSPAFQVSFYLSTNTTITDSDVNLGNFPRDALDAGNFDNFGALLSIPGNTTNGLYYIGAIINLVDADANNNVNYDPTPISISNDPEIRVRPSTLNFTEEAPGSVPVAPSATAAETLQREQTRAILPALLDEAVQQGEVRVIVGLDMPFEAEGRLDATGKSNQRAMIRSRQQALMEDLAGLSVQENARYRFIPYLALTVSEAALEELAASPRVRSIEKDPIDAPSMASSNIVIGSPLAWAEGYDGSGQAVAVLDTGTETDHSWFTTGGNKIVSEACYSTTVETESNSVCPGGVSSSTAVGSGVDCAANIEGCDHGTHVAGTVAGNDGSGPNYGVARGADIIPIQVFSEFLTNCGSDPVPCARTYGSDQLLALERVLELSGSIDIAAVNMSLGGGQYFDQASCDAANGSRKAAIDNLRAAGIATVIAAGNDSYTDSIGAPACISTAVSVGATRDDDLVASFSNIYPQIHLLAPGVSIDSSEPGNTVGNKQGTSMATPHVAGAWAVLKQMSPAASVDEILTMLQNTATPVDDLRAGGVETGMPRINLDLALGEPRTTFGIFNDGPGSLDVSSIASESPAPWLSVDPAGPFEVPVGGLQVVQVMIDYGSAPPGTTQSRLLVNSNDPDESPWPGGVFVNVTPLNQDGPEYSSIPAGGATLNFGNQQVNTESDVMDVQVSNDGNQNLTLACQITGANSSDFNLKACATPVAPAAMTNLSVSCEPANTGAKSATLTVTTNDADEGQVDYSLSCNGTEPPNEDVIEADGFEDL